ncbi:MAG: PAT family beta-lactamase induction signal transducer AmpG [Francisellaceae bacterium]|jgi:PAT family beta-lactamase induction signal transducer AmpG
MITIHKIKEACIENFKTIFSSRIMLTMFLLGFSSGLPRMLVASTFIIWFTKYGVSVESIGLLTLILFPYTVKFLWSPLIDRYALPWFDRRKSWILITQILLITLIGSLSFLSPNKEMLLIAIIGLLVSITSATQDIAFNAYQVEILNEDDRAIGASISSLGYRVAMYCMSTIIIFIVVATNWHIAFLAITSLMLIGIVGTYIAPKTNKLLSHCPPSLYQAVILPFKEYFSRDTFFACIFVILIIIIYKLGDSLAFSLNSYFFLSYLHFSLIDIAIAYKTSALIFSLTGLVIGGLIVKKIGIYKGFLWFSLLMACANLMYLLLAIVGKSYILMVVAVAVEYFVGSMGSAVLVAFLLSLCNKSFSATQFALFSSIDTIGSVFIGPFAGWTAGALGWVWLFFFSFIIGIITTGLIFLGKKQICRIANLHPKT